MTVRFGSHFSVAGCSWVQVARDSVKNLSCDDNSYNNYSSSDVFFRTINNGSVIVILVDLFLAENFAIKSRKITNLIFVTEKPHPPQIF